jgi:hypothetical protein
MVAHANARASSYPVQIVFLLFDLSMEIPDGLDTERASFLTYLTFLPKKLLVTGICKKMSRKYMHGYMCY